jgi:hypothetical protein
VFAYFIFSGCVLCGEVRHLSLDIVVVTEDEQLGGPGLPIGLDDWGDASLLDLIVVLHERVPGLGDLKS